MFFENPHFDAPSAVSGRRRRRLRRRNADCQKTSRNRLRNGRPGSALGAILGVFGFHLGSVWLHFGVPRRLGEPSGPTAGAKPKSVVDPDSFLTVLGPNFGSLGGPLRHLFGCFLGSIFGSVLGPSRAPSGARLGSLLGSIFRPKWAPEGVQEADPDREPVRDAFDTNF